MEKKYSLDFEQPLRGLIKQLDHLQQLSTENKIDVSSEIAAIEAKIENTKRDIYSSLSPWQRVQLARHPQRPYALDYIERIFEGFQEFKGDRSFRDDKSIIGGPAFFNGQAVMIIAQQKGRNTKETIMRNFGMPNPEGYRKALRLMKMAEKFGLPLFTLVDTPGAYPGIGSEERHVAEAIAVNIREMSMLRVPIVTAIIGEGGSGGALGIAVGDRVLILENAYYSVISPEGCAAILWKDSKEAPKAAAALKLGAKDLLQFGAVDEVIAEPMGGAHTDFDESAANLRRSFVRHLEELAKLEGDDLVNKRYERYRHLGEIEEKVAEGKVVPIKEAAS